MSRMRPAGTGQVAEWLVWSALVARSAGRLHVFLPTRDMGVDGLVRDPAADVAVPVQVKARTELEDSVLRIHVQEEELTDPHAHVVAALCDLERTALCEPVLCMSAAELRERSHLVPYGPRRAWAIEVPWPPGTHTRWRDLCVSLEELPARLVPALAEAVPEVAAPEPEREAESAVTGYMGEVELLRCAAARERLNAFHAFPDNEFVEYLLRHTTTGGIIGVQVKCIGVFAEGESATVKIPFSGFRASPRSHLVVFARGDDGEMGEECLLIPSEAVPEVATRDSDAFHIEWSGRGGGRWERFAVDKSSLGARLEELAERA